LEVEHASLLDGAALDLLSLGQDGSAVAGVNVGKGWLSS